MSKAISGLIVMVLLLMISVSLVAAIYVWSSSIAFESYPEESISRSYLRSRACLSLEEIDGVGGTATLRNCGLIPLSNFTLYIDGEIVSSALPDDLDPNEGETITFDVQTGEHGYLVVSDIIETPYITK